MNNNIVLVILLVAFILIAGFFLLRGDNTNEAMRNNATTTTENTVTTTDNTQSEVAVALTSTTWRWHSATIGGETVSPELGDFLATFTTDGTFSSTTDCNSVMGGYEADNTTINFGALAGTRMACEGATLEMTYAAGLEAMETYTVSENKLTLTNAAGDNMIFHAE